MSNRQLRMRRIIAMVIAALSVASFFVLGHVLGNSQDRANAWAATTEAMPVVRMGVNDATWVCGASTVRSGTTSTSATFDTPSTIELFNSSDFARVAIIRALPQHGVMAAEPTRVDVPAATTVHVEMASLVIAPSADPAAAFASAVVDIDGGGVLVQQIYSGSALAVLPCATAASKSWYFAAGSTTKDASMIIALTNPSAETATLDFKFESESGPVAPDDLAGIVVAPLSTTVVNIGDHVRRREFVATSIKARSGKVVATRLEQRSDSARRGISVATGIAQLSSRWYFASAPVSDSLSSRFEFYNPGAMVAQLEVTPLLADAQVEPFTFDVASNGHYALDLATDSRVPHDVPVAYDVRSTNGATFATERSADGRTLTGPLGMDDMRGVAQDRGNWLVVFPKLPTTVLSTDSQTGMIGSVSIFNPGTDNIEVGIHKFLEPGSSVPVLADSTLTIPARQTTTVAVTTTSGSVVDAWRIDAPSAIVVQSDLKIVGRTRPLTLIATPVSP